MGDTGEHLEGTAEDEMQRRLDAETQLNDLRLRVDSAQQLANMGDYDWHMPTDTNRWSDQLYRIYGYEPQSFNASYERFLALLHPEDREHVQAVHQHALATGEPYEMTERIIRPDGELRYLSTNGQVLFGEDGVPVRMRGTCIDITERVRAEREREEHAARAQAERMRRRAAFEINDNVVQGLTAALYALEVDDEDAARGYVLRTLDAARKVITDLGSPLEGDDFEPGDLVRKTASSLDRPPEAGGTT